MLRGGWSSEGSSKVRISLKSVKRLRSLGGRYFPFPIDLAIGLYNRLYYCTSREKYMIKCWGIFAHRMHCCLLYSILMFFFLFAVNFVIFSLRATILNSNKSESESECESEPHSASRPTTLNTPVLKFSRAIFAISILNPNYDVINDVISGFAKVVVERCGFHHWIAQKISWGEVVSVFLYLL